MLVLLLSIYLLFRVGAVLGRRHISRLQGDFIGAVVRRLGHPIRTLGVYISFLGSGAVHASRRTVSRIIHSSISRLSGLSTCLQGLHSVAHTSSRRARLSLDAFSLGPIIRGLVHLRRTPKKGRMSFRARFASGLLIATSPIRVTGVVDGLVRGTIGCSKDSIDVQMRYHLRNRRLALGISSSNVNVPISRRKQMFSGFCHDDGLPSHSLPNVNLKLDCIGLLIRTREKAIFLADRVKEKAAIRVAVPRWSTRVSVRGVGDGS